MLTGEHPPLRVSTEIQPTRGGAIHPPTVEEARYEERYVMKDTTPKFSISVSGFCPKEETED